MILTMLAATTMMLTACSTDSPYDEYNSNLNPGTDGGVPSSGDIPNGGNGTSTAGTGELITYQVAIDKTTAEPTSTVAAYYPEADDDITTQTFDTQVTIDMSSPVAKTENGVEITISGDSIIANHGKNEGICYVVSGTTSNGMLYIDGKTNFMLKLNGADITSTKGTAIDIQSKKAAYLVLTGSNKLTDGTTEDHKSALYSKGKLIISGTGSLDVNATYNNGIHSKSYIVIEKGVNLYVYGCRHQRWYRQCRDGRQGCQGHQLRQRHHHQWRTYHSHLHG